MSLLSLQDFEASSYLAGSMLPLFIVLFSYYFLSLLFAVTAYTQILGYTRRVIGLGASVIPVSNQRASPDQKEHNSLPCYNSTVRP